jgi:hypothetical protein
MCKCRKNKTKKTIVNAPKVNFVPLVVKRNSPTKQLTREELLERIRTKKK